MLCVIWGVCLVQSSYVAALVSLQPHLTCACTLLTPRCILQLSDALAKKGHNVSVSLDAGRFLCNWIYFTSLCRSQKEGTISLFVHVRLRSFLRAFVC